jgi:cytochrome P450
MTARLETGIPSSDIDLFTDEALTNPYPLYRALRDLAPIVYLEKLSMFALTRYDQVREALDDWETFSSSDGVGLNEPINQAMTGTIINTDPPGHTKLRTVISSRMAPRALNDMRADIDRKADEFIERLLTRTEFDAMTDLARVFPVTAVLDALGFPLDGREKLLHWGGACFNAMGPANPRGAASFPEAAEMFTWLAEKCTADAMIPGGFATTIHEAAARGDIPRDSVEHLLAAYAIPSLDTTVSAIGSSIWLFAQHPDQWDLVRADPTLIPRAFAEALRLESPVPWFGRTTRRPYTAGGLSIEPGRRVLVSYASSNRDERRYPDPDRFDVTRDNADHIAFGYGIHSCPGQGLAKFEGFAIIDALARRVERFEVVGEPKLALNNMTRSLGSLPVRVTLAR